MKVAPLLFSVMFGTGSLLAQGMDLEVGELTAELAGKTVFLNREYLVFPVEAKEGEKLPLLIYLHGAGAVGDEIRRISGPARGVVQGIAKFKKGPCVVVAPQCLRAT
ncbi:MAG: hypothetical protein GWO24_00690, partial [Akkermansiaceae bacterium]|nr:hypothetical protein [Akkermansiaceae bacterium]